ncbi:MAG: MMPL family transporter [Actinocatenispora sp.]
MIERAAQVLVRRRWIVLAATLVFLALSGIFGGDLSTRLSVGGYTDPDTESARATSALHHEFHTGDANLVLLVTDKRGVDDPEVAAAGVRVTKDLADESGVKDVNSYWVAGKARALRSDDSNRAVIVARLTGDDDVVTKTLKRLRPDYHGTVDGLKIRFGGTAEVNQELSDQSQQDLVKAESIAFPITLVVLVVVFGGIVAALVPLALAVVIMLGTILTLRTMTTFTSVSVFAMEVTIGLGLGLAIDYSLLIISRYREELASGADVPTAIATSLRTAGRSVMFSALVVALALSGLLLFPFYFLRSFAYAGIPVTLLAAIGSMTVLPALLAVLGKRIDKLRIRKPKAARPMHAGFWYRLATGVMRRPVVILLLGVVVLGILGSPFLHLRITLPDERVMPRAAESAQVGDVLKRDFDDREFHPLTVYLDGVGASDTSTVSDYATKLSRMSKVSRVDSLAGSFADGSQVAPPSPTAGRYATADATYLTVVTKPDDPLSDDTQQLVRDIRDGSSPQPIRVSGDAAQLVDAQSSIASSLPWVIAVVVVSLFLVLFLLTGSLVMPLKALILNTLSLSATFGALVWIFQDGHLRSLFGDFIVTDAVIWTVPMLLFCITFGLSMDYEVFLLSRIKEEYDRGGDNTGAVAAGLERTGRLITAAALLIAIVFLAFTSSGITSVKEIGLGMALAVLVDATVIRVLLVPAFMRLMGRANWWAPGPLRRLHDRFGLRESGEPAAPAELEPAGESAVRG